MSRNTSGITSRPAGSVGSLTYQRGRDKHGNPTIVRQRPFPENPKTTLQERNREHFAIAQQLARLVGKTSWSGAWAARKRSGYQVLTTWLRSLLVYDEVNDRWGFVPTTQTIILGPGHVPDTITKPSSGQVNWSTECRGDHCAPDDLIHGCLLPRFPTLLPIQPPWGEPISGVTRAQGFWRPSTYPTHVPGETEILLWTEHREGSRTYWSPAVAKR